MKIERVFHRIWVGPADEPAEYAAFAGTWLQHHPGWELVQWGDNDLTDLTNQMLFDDAELYAPHSMVGQFRADIARYELLYRFGGVYIDADFECLGSIEPLITDTDLFAVRERPGRIANGLMGSVPDHPFIGRMIDALPDRCRKMSGDRPAKVTGPAFLTLHDRTYPGELTVLPTDLFFPYGWDDVEDPERCSPPWPDECVAVHHWQNQRRHRGLPSVG